MRNRWDTDRAGSPGAGDPESGAPAAGALAQASNAPETSALAAAAPRPAAELAAALAIGAWSGSMLAGEALLPGGLLLAATPLLFVSSRRLRRVDGLLLLLALVSCWRAWADTGASRPQLADEASEARAGTHPIDETVLVGSWSPLDRSGRVGRLPRSSAASTTFILDGAPPRPGDWIAVLPGDSSQPLPAGPVPGPSTRRGDTARRNVRADAWLRLDAIEHDSRAAPVGLRALGVGAAARVGEGIERLRGATRIRLETLEELGAPVGLARALVLGESQAIPHAFEDLTRRTGVRHLLAVSGMHVGLVCLLLVLPISRRGGRAAGLLALLLFVVVSGAASPVVRAGIGAGLALIAPSTAARRIRHGRGAVDGRFGNRRTVTARCVDGGTLWSLAFAFELLLRPSGLGQIGLQLSYLATAGLLLAARPVRNRLQAWMLWPLRERLQAPRLRPHPAVLVATRTSGAVAATVGASCAALVMTLPVLWAVFGEAAPVGLLLTPLALLPIAAALLTGLFAPLLPLQPAADALSYAAASLVWLLSAADRLPGTPWPLPERPAWFLGLLGLLTLAQLRVLGGHSLSRFAWPAASLQRLLLGGLGLALLPWSPAPARLELHVLDSGHGTCVIARGPGLPAIVFDGGSRDRTGLYREALGPALARWDVPRPVVVLSHDHRDHQNALAELVSRRPPVLWAGSLSRAVELPPQTPVASLRSGSARLPRPWRGPIEAELHRGLDAAGNEGSVALELRTRRGKPDGRSAGKGRLQPQEAVQRVLLLGDAEAEGLAAMLESGRLPRDVAILLAPHHGSETPLLSPLLEWTRPAAVWIPSAAAPPIARELERRGIPWSSPSIDGPLRLVWPPPEPPGTARAERESPTGTLAPNSLSPGVLVENQTTNRAIDRRWHWDCGGSSVRSREDTLPSSASSVSRRQPPEGRRRDPRQAEPEGPPLDSIAPEIALRMTTVTPRAGRSRVETRRVKVGPALRKLGNQAKGNPLCTVRAPRCVASSRSPPPDRPLP